MKLDDLPPQALPRDTGDTAPAMPQAASMRLGAWSFYFLAKLFLFWRELIGFHAAENLAFAALLLLPLRSPAWRRIRLLIAVPLGAALLYHDSWLPPFERAWSQAGLLAGFSFSYLLELAGRFVDWPMLALLFAGWAAYRVIARHIRVGVPVVLSLAVMALVTPGRNASEALAGEAAPDAPALAARKTGSDSLDGMVQEFYAAEAQRKVRFPAAAQEAPFDIVFIHVCSLSWDDLRATGLDKHPLWGGMDFLFRRFNSVASYSGPAAVRINRATCGQTPHGDLYKPAADDCYLMPNLQRAGFEPNLAFNHDGHFDDFLLEVRKQGLSAPLMPLSGVAAPQRAFDNSPIYDDFAVLSRWLENRQKADAQRVALFYNTISLHDGNRIVAGPDSRLSSLDSYKPRVEKLLNDLNGFMERLQNSGRRTVVVVVPEHGAALRGDKFQMSGLREIPTPLITSVPVGVRVIGPGLNRKGAAAEITAPASYIGLSQLIAGLMAKSPYAEAGFAPADYVQDVSGTDYVAENDGSRMVARDGRYFLKQGNDAWREYPSPQSSMQ